MNNNMLSAQSISTSSTQSQVLKSIKALGLGSKQKKLKIITSDEKKNSDEGPADSGFERITPTNHVNKPERLPAKCNTSNN